MTRTPICPSAVAALIVVVAVVPWTWPADGARILAVQSVGGKSHWNFMSAVLRPLTDAGHTVTVFTQFPDGDRDNYTEVDTSRDFPLKLEHDVVPMIEAFGRPMPLMNKWALMSRLYCDMVFRDRRLNDIREGRGDERFDVIIMEILPNDCMSHLASALDVPIVYVIPSPMYTFVERRFTGHTPHPGSVAHFISDHVSPGTFVQRLTNIAISVYSELVFVCVERVLKIADPKPYDTSPTVRPSIVFQNVHYITDASRPIPPNVVQIGGIHLKPADFNRIPKDILDFIEDSPDGVIYFTFGSTIKMSSMPEHIETAFKEAIAQVPQKVLWKYEGEMKDMPKNVMIKKWFPQREILLHPKIKLFISHGGMSGIYETVDAGVPVLGFPLFFDQSRNIAHLVHNEMAISMDLLKVTKDTILNAILELINNNKYKINAKIASQRLNDRPISPEKLVVYWTEYVIRHKGAPHLRYNGINLEWYQYYHLDVIVVVLIFILLIILIISNVFKFMYKCIIRCTKNNKVKIQ